MGIISDTASGVKPMMEKSDKVHTAVGSGARPVKSKVMIETSAPPDPHTLGRAPKDWLK